MLSLVLLVVALICFIIATIPSAVLLWNRLVAAGLAAWVGSMLLGAWGG